MKRLELNELRAFLEEKYDLYNRPAFIATDPVSIPHLFSGKEDREIAGFLAATIAWGQRPTILKNASSLLRMMGNAPYDYVMSAREKDLLKLESFVHRTFNGADAIFFVRSLQHIYRKKGGLQKAFLAENAPKGEECLHAIMNFRELFLSIPYPPRVSKHVSDPSANSAAKRLCMFLRWMIRNDGRGVDLGLWRNGKEDLLPSQLMCPLDVHSGNVARKLGLLTRRQNDWKAVTELTMNLRRLDPDDPVKYDFALFGLGVFERF